MGTPQELTDNDGNVVWANYEFAWGGRYTHYYTTQSLNDCAILEHELQPIRFQGQFFDTETSLHYNRFRYYDSDVGMFIQRDPIGLLGGVNVYQYAPNPVGWVDPWGLINYRDKFWNRVGQADRTKYQVHHIIPQAVFSGGSSGQYKTASAILKCHKMDKDSFISLIGLPKDVSDNPRVQNSWFGKSQHNSSHDGYSDAVSDAIVRIGRAKSCAVQKSKLLSLQKTLRKGLKDGKVLMPALGATKADWDLYLRGF